MSLSTLPLSYCTNVHAGRTVSEVQAGLREYTAPVSQEFRRPLAAGLWLARSVVDELLQSSAALQQFVNELTGQSLTCHTLNAFPFGDFHSPRVKENVYLPDWSEPSRLRYTLDCAQVLAALLSAAASRAENVEGSISTVPLGFKQFEHPPTFVDRCIDQLLETARGLNQLHQDTGQLIRLAVEPEPLCVLETTDEAIAFFTSLFHRADEQQILELAQRHLGVCYDVCHQAVEFEDVAASIRRLRDAGIRINKVHITCAIELRRPAENAAGREALAHYVEPRYLHQTMALTKEGNVHQVADLTSELALSPAEDFRDAVAWRVHFHVPVDAERLGPLETTRSDLKTALAAVAALDYAPHLEVETYTWEVLPGGEKTDLVDGLTQELRATQTLLDALQR